MAGLPRSQHRILGLWWFGIAMVQFTGQLWSLYGKYLFRNFISLDIDINIRLVKSHDGKYLASVVGACLERFGLAKHVSHLFLFYTLLIN
jgi:hypothetical protein